MAAPFETLATTFSGLRKLSAGNSFGRPFIKRFALCYRGLFWFRRFINLSLTYLLTLTHLLTAPDPHGMNDNVCCIPTCYQCFLSPCRIVVGFALHFWATKEERKKERLGQLFVTVSEKNDPATRVNENHLICFLYCPRNTHNLSQSFHLKGFKTCFFILLSVQLSQPYVSTGQATLSLVLSSLKSVCCDFSIFSAVMPRLPAIYLTW